jgi:hypothetical protein
MKDTVEASSPAAGDDVVSVSATGRKPLWLHTMDDGPTKGRHAQEVDDAQAAVMYAGGHAVGRGMTVRW